MSENYIFVHYLTLRSACCGRLKHHARVMPPTVRLIKCYSPSRQTPSSLEFLPMHHFAVGFSLTLALTFTLGAADWNQFRGPGGEGHAEGKPPTEWDAKKNVTWRKELPGNGWSSPVVVGGKIYLT